MAACNLCGKRVQPYIDICGRCSTERLGFTAADLESIGIIARGD